MPANWQIGDRINNRWQVVDKIESGGMGILYVVYDHDYPNAYVAKTFRHELFARNPQVAARFEQEALCWVKLDLHPNVTHAHFVERIAGRPFVFLEWVRGGDLSSWIGTARLTEDSPQVLRFCLQLCDGMVHARMKGIKAHRDIKPQNCLVTEEATLKLTDFGLAKIFHASKTIDENKARRRHNLRIDATQTGIGVGTFPYMAPEQFDDAKHVDVRADIYSFGVMLFEMVTGKLPFIGRTRHDFALAHKNQMPTPLPGGPSHPLAAVLHTCLNKDPARRFGSFRELREVLATVFRDLTGHPAPVPMRGSTLTAEAWIDKGVSLTNLGRPEEALACHDRALGIVPDSARAWINKGAAFGTLEQWEQCLASYERGVELAPDVAYAWAGKARVLSHLGRPDEALICYDRALAINPLAPSIWSNKGALLADHLKRWEDAISCYDHTIRIDPHYAEAHLNKAVALVHIGRDYEALDCFERTEALGLSIGAEQLHLKGCALLRLNHVHEALECFLQVIGLRSNHAPAHDNIGVAYERLNQLSEALSYYERAVELDPKNAFTRTNMGNCLRELDRMEDALISYGVASKLAPNDPSNHINAALVLEEMGRPQEAMERINDAVNADANYAAGWYALGSMHARSGRFNDAISAFQKSASLGHPEAGSAIAGCLPLGGGELL